MNSTKHNCRWQMVIGELCAVTAVTISTISRKQHRFIYPSEKRVPQVISMVFMYQVMSFLCFRIVVSRHISIAGSLCMCERQRFHYLMRSRKFRGHHHLMFIGKSTPFTQQALLLNNSTLRRFNDIAKCSFGFPISYWPFSFHSIVWLWISETPDAKVAFQLSFIVF